MLSTRDCLQIERHIQTKNKKKKTDISCKFKQIKSYGSNTYIKQKILKQRL